MNFGISAGRISTLALLLWSVLAAAGETQLPASLFQSLSQSSSASASYGPSKALDGNPQTASVTTSTPGSFWSAQLGRPYPLTRVEIVNRAAPVDAELANLTLRLFNLDDQIVFQTNLVNPGPAATLSLLLPAGLQARSVWIGLLGNQTNGGGNYYVGLAEVRLFGDLRIPFAPEPIYSSTTTNLLRVYQSSDYSSEFPPSNALDGDANTFTHTANFPDSYWLLDLGQVRNVDRVEVVNRIDCCANRLAGLTLRIFDGASNSVDSATLTNPGAGGLWTHTSASSVPGRYIRIGLENGKMNADGNYYVTLAEVRVFSGTTNLATASTISVAATTNLASHKNSYMVRFIPSLPPAANANDDDMATEVRTTQQSVDAFWEVDLGSTLALYAVRTVAAANIGWRLTNTVLRLYDEAHQSVFANHLTGTPDVFDSDLKGPVFARFVRVGLEDKQRTDPAGGLEWYIGMREVEVFGRPTNEVGILNFSSPNEIVSSGSPATLTWSVGGVSHVDLHPGLGSMGNYTGTGGKGSLSLHPTNSMEYVLLATNSSETFSSALSVEADGIPLPVRLSELVADNQYSLSDGYGQSSDWLELRNPANHGVNLLGYGLSDDPAHPMKWLFPSTNLAPHSALIVFASGRATAFDPAGNLHANFQLNKAGGRLILTAPDSTNTVDQVQYPELDADLAYGRDLEAQWRFLEPSPGKINSAKAWDGWLKPLSFSHARGFYEAAFTLSITNPNPGANVFYSLNGSIPSTMYATGIPISSTKAFRALVSKPGYRPARIQTQTFIFIDSVINSPVMQTSVTKNPSYTPRMRPGLLSLPAISLVSPTTPNYDEQEGSVEVLWPDGSPPVQANCGVEIFGGSWQRFPKDSFRIKCRAKYGTSKLHTPLFQGFGRGVAPVSAFDELEFRAGDQDMIDRGFYMSGRFVEDAMLDMGNLNPHGRFVHVYLNGVYWGQYDAREPLVEHFLADYLGGAAEDYVRVRGNDNIGDDFILGTPEPPQMQPWERVLADKSSYKNVRSYLDVGSLIDFMLLWFYGDCESEFRACGSVQAGSGFKFWEADADGFLRTSALGLDRIGNVGPGGLFGGLVAEGNSDFKMLLGDHIYRHCFNNGALTPGRNLARLNARMAEVHDSLLAECARWGFRTPANWESAASAIRANLFPTRTTQLVTALRSHGLYPNLNPPSFNQFGGLVTNGFQPQLSAVNATIYYTLDGTDPRLPGGALSPKALAWSPGAVSVTHDLTLTTRARTSNGAWSPLAEPRFLLATRTPPTPSELLITEIYYNPTGSDDLEFVELWNAGTNLLDLSGVSLQNAVSFSFPETYALEPGAFTVVARNSAAFFQQFQNSSSPWFFSGLSVAGEWTGTLPNSGGTLSLVGSNGVPLLWINYGTKDCWPSRANGQGSSLELRQLPPSGTDANSLTDFLNDPRHWAHSSLAHGSPGRFDDALTSIRINEVQSHPSIGDDWVELFNAGAEPIELANCALTDNMELPTRWLFPTNAIIAGGHFLVLSSSQLGFGFSKLGDSLYLLQLSGTNVIRFLDNEEFSALEPDVTCGAFERSDGILDFTALRAATLYGTNALPRFGPLVISEVMLSPQNGLAQYVELANITAEPVSLFDPLHPTNVWTTRGLGDFSFPPGLVVPACSTLILCSTNPESFRVQYGLGLTDMVVGPWPGTLNPTNDTLQILKPGIPESNGRVPYYIVDSTAWGAFQPWSPQTAGVSLEKTMLEAYGNDPLYWQKSKVEGTPGTPVHTPPRVLGPSGRQTIAQDEAVNFHMSADPAESLWRFVNLTAAELPAGATYDSVSGVFQWLPTSGRMPGNYEARFTATSADPCETIQTSFILPLTITGPLALQARLVSGELRISFPAITDQTYILESSDTLLPLSWQPIQQLVADSGNGLELTLPAASAGAQRFYRVRWVR